MNFSYGLITIVGVLAAISIGFIAMDPNDVIEPRVVVEENLVACTMQWDPMCGVDGKTYGNQCGLDAADIELDYSGECIDVETIPVTSYIMPKTAIVGETLLLEVEFRDDDKNIVDHVNYDISATQNGESILSEPGSHRHPGMHSIHETITLDESSVEILVVIQGLGHGEDITEPIGVSSSISVIPEATSEPELLPMTAIVSIPAGAAVPGCDDTDECYLPYEVTVAIGATVSWSNDDSAAHTVTSGKVPETDGIFDSSLFMSGSIFEFTFDEAGTYDYFCLIHPWMTGIVNVN